MDFCKSRISKMWCAVVLVFMVCGHQVSGDVVVKQNAIPEGSADATAVPAETTTKDEECLKSWEGFENTFLRGVKEHFIIYNNTSFDDCIAICCRKTDFECESLSYSVLLEMCIIMNITRFHKDARLEETRTFRHYHRVYPGDNTTVAPETSNFTTSYSTNETTPETTSHVVTEPTPSTESTTGTTSTIITTTTTQAVTEGETSAPTTTAPVPTERSTVTSASTSTELKLTTATSVQTRITSTTSKDVAASEAASPSRGTGLVTESTTPQVVVISTTETVTILPDTTMTAKTSAPATASDRPAVAGSTLAIAGPETTVNNCPKDCKNGGKCEWVISSKDTKANINYASSECVCPKGFQGKHCEKRLATAGVPSYIIAVAVLGSIILILFLTVVIIYALYRSRTGKYRVREQRERWNKTTTARRAQSFNSMPTRSPVGSELSVPGSVNSTTTRTTATSV